MKFISANAITVLSGLESIHQVMTGDQMVDSIVIWLNLCSVQTVIMVMYHLSRYWISALCVDCCGSSLNAMIIGYYCLVLS